MRAAALPSHTPTPFFPPSTGQILLALVMAGYYSSPPTPAPAQVGQTQPKLPPPPFSPLSSCKQRQSWEGARPRVGRLQTHSSSWIRSKVKPAPSPQANSEHLLGQRERREEGGVAVPHGAFCKVPLVAVGSCTSVSAPQERQLSHFGSETI